MSDTKKMKFHIIITDNETGETLHNSDACAILAGINEGGRTGSLMMTDCGPTDLAETLRGTEKIVQVIRSKHPEIGALSMLLNLINKGEQSEEPETEETKNEDFE